MRLLRRGYEKLHLAINDTKSAFGRKFLGCALWKTRGCDVWRAVSTKTLQAFKLRIRQLTRGLDGRSMAHVVEKLRSYLLG
jgi:hypothetical protein|tara:strand:- start:2707 stop:2949 length:243 start_codon:yes stop_codon:yes gene_type:complete